MLKYFALTSLDVPWLAVGRVRVVSLSLWSRAVDPNICGACVFLAFHILPVEWSIGWVKLHSPWNSPMPLKISEYLFSISTGCVEHSSLLVAIIAYISLTSLRAVYPFSQKWVGRYNPQCGLSVWLICLLIYRSNCSSLLLLANTPYSLCLSFSGVVLANNVLKSRDCLGCSVQFKQ